LVSKHLNRRVSRPLARLLARTPITPNQVSVVSFAIALASLGLFLGENNVWAGLAVQASSIVDGADGDLARLKGMASRFGGYFDSILDRYADVAILTGLTYWSYAFEGRTSSEVVVSLGLAALVGAQMVSYSRARAEATLGLTFHGVAGALASRDARLLVIMIGAILGQALVTLALLAIVSHAVVIYRVALARRTSS
jgi:CDP-L-myo-inositol myo-inositolphosphotransferase